MPTSTAPQLPKGWPPGLPYLIQPTYSLSLTPSTLQRLRTHPPNTPILSSKLLGPSPLVRIRPIASPAHPANGQYGLFAARDLPPDSFVLLYVGHVHGAEDADARSDYDLCLDGEMGVGVDAARGGNEARFVNDYRGIEDGGPNAEFREVWVERGQGTGKVVEKGMGVFVLSAGKSGRRAKGIVKGKEILKQLNSDSSGGGAALAD
ncbi:hypothetical protein H2201_007256 [Coniosporium apollinis]|uniref:SET domain-containing protein n=1 Tax=Coniosporium apollinis TaxID=61459 RepID=A0ABQ9NJS4_9PEZI|nr:hypothetical protein H2201_007256 [Coniosporium apollinis]